MMNTMDGIFIKLSGCSKKISINQFLLLNKGNLNFFEQKVFNALKEIYHTNRYRKLFKFFPRRNIPLIIDCRQVKVKSGWVSSYSGMKNRIILSHELGGDDLLLTLIHELKHAEQWFDDSDMNNYQRHQTYCLYEVLAKLFVGEYLGRGAYFGRSLEEALKKWFDKHYLNYKEKYDQQWPIGEFDLLIKNLPKSFGIPKEQEKKVIEILNKRVLKS